MNGIEHGEALAMLLAFMKNGKGGSSGGIFVGYVNQSSTGMPTKRPDGSALQNYDFVRPSTNAVFPFTVGGLTFNHKTDRATYLNGSWILDTGVEQETSETPVTDKKQESVNGEDSTAQMQSDINKENVAEFAKKRRTDKAQNEWWFKEYEIANTFVKSMDGALVTSYSAFMNKIKAIMSDSTAEPKDKFVPYTPAMCCLVKSIDLTSNDIVMDAYCYSNGKRVVVTKYLDAESKERYKVYEVDFTQPIPNKFVQNTLSDEWVIEHNLLKYPAIQVKDENDDLVFPADIEYIDLMTVKIKFSEPIKGYATLN